MVDWSRVKPRQDAPHSSFALVRFVRLLHHRRPIPQIKEHQEYDDGRDQYVVKIVVPAIGAVAAIVLGAVFLGEGMARDDCDEQERNNEQCNSLLHGG